MTGLNLEALLRILRADLGAWASLGLVGAILAVMTWTSWGSKRALRKCLFLSIAAHVGLIGYGSSSPAIRKALKLDSTRDQAQVDRPVRVIPWMTERSTTGPEARPSPKVAAWDLDRKALPLTEPGRLFEPPARAPAPSLTRAEPEPVATKPVVPNVFAPTPPPTVAALTPPNGSMISEPPPTVADIDPSEVAAPVVLAAEPLSAPSTSMVRVRPNPADHGIPRIGPERVRPPNPSLPEPPKVEVVAPRVAPSTESVAALTRKGDSPTIPAEDLDPGPPIAPTPIVTPSTADSLPDPGVRRLPRPVRVVGDLANVLIPNRQADGSAPPAMARVAPTGPSSVPSLPRPVGRRPLSDVPPVYRSRLDPNRAVLAQRAGASVASEQAVERALDWLARHQDAADGRWDGGTAKYRDGSVPENDDSFTIHCPAGEVCFGECFYWEADTALTGLSLLAYLGAGYTHLDGKYASVVGKGIEFLLKSQKADGDLRGQSVAVGMYCHSMATLALCEAYALTGDLKLRSPVEKALAFLVRSRAVDGLAWRYAPGAPSGDTSILGWAVMALKSGRTVGVPIPTATQAGIVGWLKKISQGRDSGLAFYNLEATGTKVTPTMTAEAWACRQFLEFGGPGPASDEAAAYLIKNGSDRGDYNIYYLYYGTLAMYQHGGHAWSTWNARVRDDVVRRQRSQGHMAGSWDPDDSPYGNKGGRIYGTALATLTLEVYYRFLRLYEPSSPLPVAPGVGDPGTRRAGFELRSSGR